MDKLTPQLNDAQIKQNIDALMKQGAPKSVVQSYVNNYKSDGRGGYVLKAIEPTGYSDTGADIKQVGTGISNAFKEAQTTANEAYASKAAGEQTGAEALFQTIGAGAKALSNSAGEIVKGAVKVALPQEAETAIKQGIGAGVNAVSDLTSKYEELQKTKPVLAGALNIALGGTPGMALTAKDIITGYNELKITNPRLAKNIDGALGIAQLAFDVATLGEGKAVATVAKDAAMTGAENVVKQTSKFAGEAAATAGSAIKDSKNTLLEAIAPNIDAPTANMLKNTPTSVFDAAEQVAKNAAESVTAPSSFEVVGEKLANATKQLDSQTKSLAEQASTIIGKAKNGLVDFTKETGEAILDINRTLKDSKIGKQFIEKLKTVKNKIQADKTINELQDMLYKGNKDMTIPTGSAEDKALRAILGKYNTKLKAGLPKAYGDLNKQMWENIKATQSLNKALGEVVEGVSTRGSGLVKQFFSPSGTKAKELFEFLKNKTGVDIAQEATVAKFMAEMYGDVKARSLLQGIPTSTSSVINKAIEFGVEKTGLGTKLKEATTSGTIGKARKLTKKAK